MSKQFRQDRSRSRTPPLQRRTLDWEEGDRFVITGPQDASERWYPGRTHGWKPRFWSGHPEEVGSYPMDKNRKEKNVNQIQVFTVLAVKQTDTFTSVQIDVGDGSLWWTNVSKNGKPWATKEL